MQNVAKTSPIRVVVETAKEIANQTIANVVQMEHHTTPKASVSVWSLVLVLMDK